MACVTGCSFYHVPEYGSCTVLEANNCRVYRAIRGSSKKDHLKYRVKGKAIPVQAWRGHEVPGGGGSQISRQSAHEGGKVVSPTHQPPLPPRIYSWYSFLLEAESGPER